MFQQLFSCASSACLTFMLIYLQCQNCFFIICLFLFFITFFPSFLLLLLLLSLLPLSKFFISIERRTVYILPNEHETNRKQHITWKKQYTCCAHNKINKSTGEYSLFDICIHYFQNNDEENEREKKNIWKTFLYTQYISSNDDDGLQEKHKIICDVQNMSHW